VTGETEVLGGKLFQCHIIHLKYHMNWHLVTEEPSSLNRPT
jgi:hypothetical protein